MIAAACGGPAATGSGIEGIVLAGPTCPAQRLDSPCAERPIAMDLIATVASSGRTVATFRSGDDGTFRVDLPPGDYLIKTARGGFAPPVLRNDVLVRVAAGSYERIELHADTGIR